MITYGEVSHTPSSHQTLPSPLLPSSSHHSTYSVSLSTRQTEVYGIIERRVVVLEYEAPLYGGNGSLASFRALGLAQISNQDSSFVQNGEIQVGGVTSG